MGNSLSSVSAITNVEFLKCAACLKRVASPCSRFINGHLVCSNCFDLVNNLRAYQSPKPNLGERILCRFIDSLILSCEFQDCKEKFFRRKSQIEHGTKCDFKLIACPVVKCKWRGLLTKILPHMKLEHKIPISSCSSFDVEYPMISHPNYRITYIQDCFDSNFVVTLTCLTDDLRSNFYLAVQLIGNGENAKNFTYTATIHDELNELVYKSDVKPITDSIDEMISREDCFKFSVEQAANFTKDDKLCTLVVIAQK